MSYEDKSGYSVGKMLLVVVVVLALIALVLWATGTFDRMGLPSNMREVYMTDTKDLSGGELRVTDESSPKVPVDVPTTAMTNVPAGAVPSPAANEAPKN